MNCFANIALQRLYESLAKFEKYVTNLNNYMSFVSSKWIKKPGRYKYNTIYVNTLYKILPTGINKKNLINFICFSG